MVCFKGKFIAFSGIDGAGKSTQIDLILAAAANNGKKPVYFWSRGGYTGPFNFLKSCLRKLLGRKLLPPGRNETRDKAFKKIWVRNLWLTLAIFDLLVVYGIYIRILRISGRYIIADRYLWDTWIDFQLNFPDAKVDQWILWKILTWFSPRPDASFMLVIPVAESLRRSTLKDEPFPDSKEVLSRRLEMYQELSIKHDYRIIDCLQPIDKIHNLIIQTI